MKTIHFAKNKENGMSLIEILVVITVFAVLAILVTSTLVLTLRGTRKSESMMETRENLNYAMTVIERNIRNANSVQECPNTDTNKISYYDQYGSLLSFSCVIGASDSYIASGSSRLTSDTIEITSCSFSCEPSDSGNPPVVTVGLTVKNKSETGVEGSDISTQSEIYLRN